MLTKVDAVQEAVAGEQKESLDFFLSAFCFGPFKGLFRAEDGALRIVTPTSPFLLRLALERTFERRTLELKAAFSAFLQWSTISCYDQ